MLPATTCESIWLATTPSTAFPPLPAGLHVDVAILGGGIVGITTAWLLRQAGYDVAVLEARKIVAGTTGNTTAKVTALHDLIYRYLIDHAGEHRARLYATRQHVCDRRDRQGDVAAGHRLRLHLGQRVHVCEYGRAGRRGRSRGRGCGSHWVAREVGARVRSAVSDQGRDRAAESGPLSSAPLSAGARGEDPRTGQLHLRGHHGDRHPRWQPLRDRDQPRPADR